MERLQRGLRALDTGHDACGTESQPASLPSRERSRYGVAVFGHHMACTTYGRKGSYSYASCQGVHGSGGGSHRRILIKIVSGHNCGLDA